MSQGFSKIWIVIILIVFIAGGILTWQYFGVPEEISKDETTEGKIIGFWIILSFEI